MTPLESILRTFLDVHPEHAARAFETLETPEAVRLFRQLPTSVAALLLERVNETDGARLLNELDNVRAGELLAAVSERRAATILQGLEDDRQTELLQLLPSGRARSLRELASFPAESAGAMMDPRVVSLSIDLTAQQAISAIRKAPRDALHYLYVTNRSGELVGVLNMRDLLLASPRDPIEPLVKRNVLSIPATMDEEEVVNLMRERQFLALPVVDFDNRLVGVVKHHEVIQAGQENAFEDLQRIVGAGAHERALSSVTTVVYSRLPWLCVNLVTAFLAGAVVALFEDVIARVAALAVLLPVVAGQGGNTGAQSLAVVMRGLALREIVPGVKRRVIAKELLAGLLNGIAIALVAAVAVFLWRYLRGDPRSFCLGLATVIGLAMIVNMVAAAASGAVIPLLLKALGRDPAQSASIFLTTVTDVIGFAAFLGLAVALGPLFT